MANNKQIRFSAKLDTQEFDKTVDALQRKLKDIYGTGEMSRQSVQVQDRLKQAGLGGGASGADRQRAVQDEAKTRRETDNFIKQQVKEQEKLNKAVNQQLENLKKLRKEQEGLVMFGKSDVEHKEKILRLEREIGINRANSAAKDQAISDALDRRQEAGNGGMGRLSAAYRKGGIGGAARAGGRMLKGMSGMQLAGMAGSAISGLATVGNMANELVYDYNSMPQKNLQSRANQSSALSQSAQNIMGGNAFQESFSAADRAKASQMAAEQAKNTRSYDTNKLGLSALAVAGGTIAAWAAATAATGGAAAIGAGVIAAGSGLYGMVGTEKGRAKTMSHLPFVGDKYKQRYEEIASEEQYQDYQKNFENLKQTQSLRYGLVSAVGGDRQRNQGLQRSLGLSDEGLYGENGGYLSTGQNAGFTRETMERNSQAILGAGGSTRMARDSHRAATMERDYNLTNAGQLMGQISGTLGSANASEQTLHKIMEKSIRAGFDTSQYAQENRKFIEVATSMAQSRGLGTEGGFERMGELLAQFSGNKTMSGIQSAQSALGVQTELSSQTTGPRAVLQAAAMEQDKDLSGLDRESKSYLMGMTRDQLTEDNPVIMATASDLGIEPKDLISKIDKVKINSVFTREKYDKAGDNLKKMVKDKGFTSMSEAMKDPEFKKEVGRAVRTDVGGELSQYQKSLTPEAQEQLIAGQYGLFGQAPVSPEELASKTEKKETTLADRQEKGQSAADKEFLGMFRQMKPEMDRAADSTGKFAAEMVRATEKLQKAFATMDGATINKARREFEMSTGQALPSTTQPQVNSPTGGNK